MEIIKFRKVGFDFSVIKAPLKKRIYGNVFKERSLIRIDLSAEKKSKR